MKRAVDVEYSPEEQIWEALMAKGNHKKKVPLSRYEVRANAANARTQQKGRGRRAVSFARGRGGKGKA